MKTTRRGRPARPSGARRRGAPRRVAPVGCVRMGGARRRPLEPYGGFLVRALKRLTFARCRGGRRYDKGKVTLCEPRRGLRLEASRDLASGPPNLKDETTLATPSPPSQREQQYRM